MKEKLTKKTLKGKFVTFSGDTKWENLDSMSEKDIDNNAKSDELNPALSDKQLSKFKRVNPVF